MWQCHYCRLPLKQDVVRRNRLCPSCGSDLHCCKNCVHYDENVTAKCREPHHEWVSDRTRVNNCHYFEFKRICETTAANGNDDMTSEAERAKEAFRALFRTP